MEITKQEAWFIIIMGLSLLGLTTYLLDNSVTNGSTHQKSTPHLVIAYQKISSPNEDIYILDLDKGKKHPLLLSKINEKGGYIYSEPSIGYSPDGTLIITFVGEKVDAKTTKVDENSSQTEFFYGNAPDVFVAPINPESLIITGKPINLTSDNKGYDGSPAVDPSGSGRIAFVTDRFNGTKDIAIINYDGRGLSPIISDRNTNGTPAWDPSGKKLAYIRNHDIWIRNIETEEDYRLTKTPYQKFNPSWSSDGNWIVYSVNHIIQMTSINGAVHVELTKPEESVYDSSPVWIPEKDEVLFVSTRGGGTNIYRTGVNISNTVKQKGESIRVTKGCEPTILIVKEDEGK